MVLYPSNNFQMQLLSGRGNRCWRVGLICGALFYVLLLQGLISAYAKTVVEIEQSVPALVICTPSGKLHSTPSDPLVFFSKDCCAAIYKAAATTGAALPVSFESLLVVWPEISGLGVWFLSEFSLSKEPYLTNLRARGPPVFFV